MKQLLSKNFVVFFLVLIFSSIFWGGLAFAEEECTPCCQCCGCFSEDTITGESGYPTCNGESWMSLCDSCCGANCAPVKVADCHPWQKPIETCGCGCACCGGCLEIPKNPRYYDNPTYSDRPEKSKDSNNIFLPVKLDWDDVLGWDQEDGPQSYIIQIEGEMRDCATNGTTTQYQTTLNRSEFVPPCSCFFESGRNYKWRVKACCDAAATNCGQWNNWWQFTANAAPEPKVPSDPDWNGDEEAKNVPLTEKLQWCLTDEEKPEAEKNLSYSLLFYLVKGGTEECHLLLKDSEGECNQKLLLPDYPAGLLFPLPEFPNKKYEFFTKATPYAWKVAACKDLGANDCTDYSQKWRFSMQATLAPPTPFSPSNDSAGNQPVGIPVSLQWKGSLGTNSYVCEVGSTGQGKTAAPSLSLDFPKLSLDTFYTWKVKPCWDYESENCEDTWSEVYTFKTTGRPPKSNTLKPEGENIAIPVTFEWENVPGAKSYRIKIKGDGLNLEKSVEEPKFLLNYPDLHQEKNYSWQIKTCAKDNGEICGKWSDLKDFKTFKLVSPSDPIPSGDGSAISFSQAPTPFSWKETPNARYYKFNLEYISKPPEESNEKCVVGEKEERIVFSNQTPTPLKCLGDYQWQVAACLDENCEEIGESSPVWHLKVTQAEAVCNPGLVPCGRSCDVPSKITPWDEKEPCQIKHLFILCYTVLNFFLWSLIPLMLVILTIISGALYYFSMGDSKTVAQVKSLWKAAGIGYALILFSWLIIDISLSILGYRVGIFGHWWNFQI